MADQHHLSLRAQAASIIDSQHAASILFLMGARGPFIEHLPGSRSSLNILQMVRN